MHKRISPSSTPTTAEEGVYFVILQRSENFDKDKDAATLSIKTTVTLTPYREQVWTS
jgi:hypothetical protein